MATRPNLNSDSDGLPDLLTVEEAAQLLRIGRTKAYAMAREWRATGGKSGLPVIDLGNVLRVPRHQFEQMIGAKLTWVPAHRGGAPATNGQLAVGPPVRDNQAGPSSNGRTTNRRSRRQTNRDANQPNLFEPRPIPNSD